MYLGSLSASHPHERHLVVVDGDIDAVEDAEKLEKVVALSGTVFDIDT